MALARVGSLTISPVTIHHLAIIIRPSHHPTIHPLTITIRPSHHPTIDPLISTPHIKVGERAKSAGLGAIRCIRRKPGQVSLGFTAAIHSSNLESFQSTPSLKQSLPPRKLSMPPTLRRPSARRLTTPPRHSATLSSHY